MKSFINKPWGSYKIIEEGKNFLVKKLFVKPQSKLSLQSHENRSEHWIVVQGKAEVTIDDKVIKLECNETVFIPQKSKHSLANNDSQDLIVIEVWYGEDLRENDIIRYEDIYGRA